MLLSLIFQTLSLTIPRLIKPEDFAQGLASRSRASLENLHLNFSRDGQYVEGIADHCPNLTRLTIFHQKEAPFILQGLKYFISKRQHLNLILIPQKHCARGQYLSEILQLKYDPIAG